MATPNSSPDARLTGFTSMDGPYGGPAMRDYLRLHEEEVAARAAKGERVASVLDSLPLTDEALSHHMEQQRALLESPETGAEAFRFKNNHIGN